ncbi:MAG: UDP-3-O-(3-hydroxymyristoyl)glucosamine N-acyltransferase [Alphaproteobacteria bacterium]
MALSKFYHPKGPFSLKVLLEKIGIEAVDKKLGEIQIHNIDSLQQAEKGELSFVYSKQTAETLKASKASACLVSKDLVACADYQNVIEVPDAHLAHVLIAQIFYPDFQDCVLTKGAAHVDSTAQVHASAQIGKGAKIGAHTKIGPNVLIGDGVEIGDYCNIHANVTISNTLMGHHVSIHPGAAIGQPGFGFIVDKDKRIDMPHLGCVVIEDHVRIGANTTIDRGVLSNTVIGAWCRIDNLVQIAHNVVLGKGCVIVSQVGIAGSTTVGDHSMLAGQVGVADHLKIGKGVKVAAQSGVSRNLEDGIIVGGSPAVPIRDWHRQIFLLNKLIKKREE